MLTNLSYAVFVEIGDSGWAIVASPLVLEYGDIDVPWYEIEGDTLYLELHKTFKQPLEEQDLFLPIVFEFEKTSESAASRIVFTDEYIVNDTGVEWFDFHIQLMVSALMPLEDRQAGFDPDFIFDGHQLEQVSYSEFVGYNGMPVRLDFMNTVGGGIPSEPSGDDVFLPGFEQGQMVIVTNPNMGVGDSFALKEMPSVPEPASLILLGIGTSLLYMRKRKLL
ncbi:MAG: PEP-CTERM sorting domain-containing protein [Planctomycetota bacterium]